MSREDGGPEHEIYRTGLMAWEVRYLSRRVDVGVAFRGAGECMAVAHGKGGLGNDEVKVKETCGDRVHALLPARARVRTSSPVMYTSRPVSTPKIQVYKNYKLRNAGYHSGAWPTSRVQQHLDSKTRLDSSLIRASFKSNPVSAPSTT